MAVEMVADWVDMSAGMSAVHWAGEWAVDLAARLVGAMDLLKDGLQVASTVVLWAGLLEIVSVALTDAMSVVMMVELKAFSKVVT